MTEKKKKFQFNVAMLVLGIVLAVYSVSLFVPIIWGMLASLKDKLEIQVNMFGLPEHWLFSNYAMVLKSFFVPVETASGAIRNVYVWEQLINSVLYAVGGAIIQTFVQFIMAYVSARFSYKYGKVIYGIVIFALAFPQVGTMASSLYIAGKLRLLDNILGMFVIKGYFLGMYFLVFHAQLKAFPKDFSEAAQIDGAGNFTIMFRIIFPMVRNTFFSIALLQFIAAWNDYTTPMLYMPNVPTLSYGLYYYTYLSRINSIMSTPMKLAACIMMVVPILVLFLVFHKRLLGNVSMGGLKE